MVKKKELKKVKEPPFAYKKSKIPGFPKREDLSQLEEPLLFIIKSSKNVEIREGAQPGRLELEIEGKPSCSFLTPERLLSIEWGEKSIKGWIIYEKEAFPYPTSVLHDSLMLESIITRVILTMEKFEKRAKQGDWLVKAAVAFFIVLIALTLYNMFVGPPAPTPEGKPIDPELAFQTVGFLLPFLFPRLR